MSRLNSGMEYCCSSHASVCFAQKSACVTSYKSCVAVFMAYLRCVLQIWLRVSICFWSMPSVSAGKLLSAVFFSLHWLSGNTCGAQVHTKINVHTQHSCQQCAELHLGFWSLKILCRRKERMHTPVLLQGGEVGQQTFMVELLQL